MNRSLSLLVTVIAAAVAIGCGPTTATASEPVPALTKEAQSAMTPDKVMAELKAGNERFVKGEPLNRNFSEQVKATSTGQYPAAIVLGCVDSRVPIEIVFDQGVGDVFSARVAGNFVNEDMLGSMEFATAVAGSKLVVVMGHTSCGAVKGACDNVQLGHITDLVNEIGPSVAAAVPEGETCSSENADHVQSVAEHNVQRTIDEIRNQSKVMRELEKAGTIKIVGAMYDVSTGKVSWMK